MDYNSDTYSTHFTSKKKRSLHIIVHFSRIYIKITIQRGVASLYFPTKYTQLPALPIGQHGNLIWGIGDPRLRVQKGNGYKAQAAIGPHGLHPCTAGNTIRVW